MREIFFIFMYGLCAVLGWGLGGFWGKMAYNRAGEISHPPMRDRYFVLSMAFALVAFGQASIDSSRVVGNYYYGLSAILHRSEGYAIGAGLVVLMLGLLVMVWLADLETHPPEWKWVRRAGVFSVAWFLIVVALDLTIGLQ